MEDVDSKKTESIVPKTISVNLEFVLPPPTSVKETQKQSLNLVTKTTNVNRICVKTAAVVVKLATHVNTTMSVDPETVVQMVDVKKKRRKMEVTVRTITIVNRTFVIKANAQVHKKRMDIRAIKTLNVFRFGVMNNVALYLVAAM